LFDSSSEKSPQSPEQKYPPLSWNDRQDHARTVQSNDDRAVTLSKRWTHTASKLEPKSEKEADKTLTELADHLLKHFGEPRRKGYPMMTDNKGWGPAFSNAVEADTKSFSKVRALVDRYNQRAEEQKLPGRVELKVDDRGDGNRFLTVRRYDPRGSVKISDIETLEPESFSLKYHLKPGD
ncbi:MAG: hypothetical protein K2Z81_26815, partial [Cyanobacteria bacterium]|nr:hypothetical protein [Cyanobacteriota bacterium]